MTLILVLLSTALYLACASADTPIFVPTEDWEPPEINTEDALEHAPWLLALLTAQEEIGYCEETAHGWNKYSAWFGDSGYGQWCTEFVVWCAAQADERWGTELVNHVYPFSRNSGTSVKWFILRDRFVSANGIIPTTGERMWLVGADHYLTAREYIPEAGDIVWLCWNGFSGGTDHTALVEGVSVEPDGSLMVHVIEGNNPDTVQRNTYPLNSRQIYGYGTPTRRANREIRLWNRNDDAKAVQAYLMAIELLRRQTVYDQMDQKAVKAVKEYQRQNGLHVTGTVDLETRQMMEKDPLFRQLVEEMHE